MGGTWQVLVERSFAQDYVVLQSPCWLSRGLNPTHPTQTPQPTPQPPNPPTPTPPEPKPPEPPVGFNGSAGLQSRQVWEVPAGLAPTLLFRSSGGFEATLAAAPSAGGGFFAPPGSVWSG